MIISYSVAAFGEGTRVTRRALSEKGSRAETTIHGKSLDRNRFGPLESGALKERDNKEDSEYESNNIIEVMAAAPGALRAKRTQALPQTLTNAASRITGNKIA